MLVFMGTNMIQYMETALARQEDLATNVKVSWNQCQKAHKFTITLFVLWVQKWDCSTIYVELLHKKVQILSFWIFQERNIWGFRGKNTTALEIRRADALHHYNVRHQGAFI